MADIKFMDISENANPAGTDSILIANKTDGVKRTTLDSLSNMIAGHQLFHLEKVQQTVDSSSSKINDDQASGSTTLTAPNVPGYTFFVWLDPCMNANYANGQIGAPDASKADLFWWISNGGKVSDGLSVQAYALYVKNNIA